jgi:hypothetical protein
MLEIQVTYLISELLKFKYSKTQLKLSIGLQFQCQVLCAVSSEADNEGVNITRR